MDILSLAQSFTLPPHVADIALLLVRIIFGVTFFYYGQFKIRDLKSNARTFEEVHGLYPGWLWGTLIALLETFGSLAVIAGLFVPFFAVLFAIHMTTGTTWKVTKTDKPFTDWSYDLLLLSISLMLLVSGPGSLAIRLF